MGTHTLHRCDEISSGSRQLLSCRPRKFVDHTACLLFDTRMTDEAVLKEMKNNDEDDNNKKKMDFFQERSNSV